MATPSPPLPLRAVDALRRGDTVEAIRLLRASTPLDLKAAKDVIEAYRRGEAVAPARPPVPTTQAKSAADAKHVIEQSAVVERMRKASGYGLAQAQDVLDTSRFRDRPTGVGGRSPGEVPRSGPVLWWIAIVALAGYALYSFLLRTIHV
jgi:ribosomal protein L7/L12